MAGGLQWAYHDSIGQVEGSLLGDRLGVGGRIAPRHNVSYAHACHNVLPHGVVH